MENKVKMQVKQVFTLSDGKSIFLGPLLGSPLLVMPGKWKLLINQEEYLTVEITGEQIMTRRAALSDYRALATRTPINKHELDTEQQTIELVLAE